MPMVYGLSLATRASVTGGVADTEFGVMQIRVGVRNAALQAFYVTGKGAGLTAISGITFAVITVTTPGAAGTALTPQPKDPGQQAAKATASSAHTIGTVGRLNHIVFGCGAAGPGGWVAPNPDSVIVREGGSTHAHEVISISGTASLKFEWSGEMVE